MCENGRFSLSGSHIYRELRWEHSRVSRNLMNARKISIKGLKFWSEQASYFCITMQSSQKTFPQSLHRQVPLYHQLAKKLLQLMYTI